MTTLSTGLGRHSLSEVDRDQMVAVCAICGPVAIKRTSNRGNGVRCGTYVATYTAQWREQNRKKARDYQRGYQRERAKSHPRSKADRFRSSLGFYGLTFEAYSQMLIDQSGRCACCGDPMKSPHIDHDHACCEKGSCGKCVRGLLCSPCNVGIARFRDNPERLRRAIAYLEGQS